MAKCFEAMEVDALSSSHPVSTPVENPAQIQEMFDDVSYDKVPKKPFRILKIFFYLPNFFNESCECRFRGLVS